MFSKSTELKFLLKTIRPYKWLMVLLVFCILLATIFDGISVGLTVPLLASLQMMESPEDLPAIMAWLFKILSGFSDTYRVLIGIIAVVVALLFKNVMLAINSRLSLWLSTRIAATLKNEALNMMMMVRIDFHHSSPVGELMMSTLTATNQVGILVNTITRVLSNVLTVCALVMLMLIISWQLFLVSILFGAIYFVLSSRYIETLKAPSAELTREIKLAHSTLQESLSGIELVKSYGREPWVLEKMARQVEKIRDLELRNSFRSQVVGWVTDVAGGVVIALLFFIGMLIYDLDAPDLLVILIPFLYIVIRLVPLLVILSHNKAKIVTFWPMLRLVSELLNPDDKQFIEDGDINFCDLKQGIEFKDVAFGYENKEIPAVRNLNFTIPEGKVTAIVGRSGSGKTTLINLLLRYFDCQQGELLIDNMPLRRLQLESYRQRISVVSQETVIFNDTVRNNIAFGSDIASLDALVEATRKAGAYDFICEMKDGFDTLLGERGAHLSGGQRQRISIARAFLKNPEILILDEATSSLDSFSEKEIFNNLESLKTHRTVIVISHRLSTIKGADQIIVLKDGQVIEKGSERELLDLEGEFYALSHGQNHEPLS